MSSVRSGSLLCQAIEPQDLHLSLIWNTEEGQVGSFPEMYNDPKRQ